MQNETDLENLYNEIKETIDIEKLESGIIYIIYACGCALPYNNSSKKISKRCNSKKKPVCPIHRTCDSVYIGKYRRCIDCGLEEIAKIGGVFANAACKDCARIRRYASGPEKNKNKAKKTQKKRRVYAKRKITTRYFQNGEEIPEPEQPETDGLCKNRSRCLDIVGYKRDVFIHCTGCPNKENWMDGL